MVVGWEGRGGEVGGTWAPLLVQPTAQINRVNHAGATASQRSFPPAHGCNVHTHPMHAHLARTKCHDRRC